MYMYIVGCDSMKVQYDNMGYNVFYVLRSTEISISLLKALYIYNLSIYTIYFKNIVQHNIKLFWQIHNR